MKRNKNRLRTIPTVLIMIVIFCFSAQHANESNAGSNYIVDQLVKVIHGIQNGFGMEQGTIDTELFTFIVRKLAHTFEYAVLGASIAFCLNSYEWKTGKKFILTLLTGFLYAFTDELHQFFVPGRSCEFRDVLIDTNGVLIGTVLFLLVARLVSKKKAQGRGH